jgi:predicted dehydrogenase
MTPDTVRWGLVGAGDIAAKRVVAALRDAPHSRLVTIARARPELAAEFATRHEIPRWHATWRELIADDEVDAVYLATPVALHAEQAVAAAEAGKHVLCEKPMALDPAQCERMLAAARAHGVRLGIAYYRHLYPVVARLRELLAGGELGRPVLAQVHVFENFAPTGEFPRAWLLNKAQSGGGPMMDYGCHRIEILLDLLGPASAVHGFPTQEHLIERDVEDTCVALLQFAGGASAVLSVSHALATPRDTFDLFCRAGSAHVDGLNQGQLRIFTTAGVREELHPAHANLHLPIVADFVDAVRQGRDPVVNGEMGLAVNRALADIYR